MKPNELWDGDAGSVFLSPPRKKGGPIEASHAPGFPLTTKSLRPVKRAAPLKQYMEVSGGETGRNSPPRKKGGPIEAYIDLDLKRKNRTNSPPRKKGGPIEASRQNLYYRRE